jgi:PKD repeat protein
MKLTKHTLGLLALLFLGIGSTKAQDSTSILFIGNSYTYFNNMPSIVADIAASFGNHVDYASQTPGGMTFAGHAGNSNTYSAMNSSNWDYVVLQAQSQEPSFPYGQVNNQTLPFAMQLADSAQAISTCSQAMFFMTWGRENGDPQWDSINTFDKMNARLRLAYLRFADSSNASVAPVGVAWKYVRDNHPEINLYTGDGSHPSYAGSYLAACTFYASVFHSSPVGASFNGNLSANEALLLQQAASLSVLDSMETWSLQHHDSLASIDFSYQIDPMNMSVSFNEDIDYIDSILWDFGDGSTSQEPNPSHTYMEPGTYLVQLIGYSACSGDTALQNILIENPVSGIQSLWEELNYSIRKTTNTEIILETETSVSLTNLRILDAMGRKLRVNIMNATTNSIRFKVNQKGPVLMYFETNGNPEVIRFFN